MKILIIGHKEHGKSTVANMICERTKLKCEDSSMAASRIFIFDLLKEKYGYNTITECYVDRRNHRAEWFNLICDYNTPNPERLCIELLKNNDIYVGERSRMEFEATKKYFDLIIGVFDTSKPLESEESMELNVFEDSDIVMLVNSDLNETMFAVNHIIQEYNL